MFPIFFYNDVGAKIFLRVSDNSQWLFTYIGKPLEAINVLELLKANQLELYTTLKQKYVSTDFTLAKKEISLL